MESNVIKLPSLEQHLDQCEQRYQAVMQRLDTLDARMTRIELLSLDIKTILTHGSGFNYDS